MFGVTLSTVLCLGLQGFNILEPLACTGKRKISDEICSLYLFFFYLIMLLLYSKTVDTNVKQRENTASKTNKIWRMSRDIKV